MGPKLLFFFGILVTHGAVGAALLGRESPFTHAPISSCVQSPAPLPYFGARNTEMLAMVIVPVDDEGEVARP